MDEDTQPAIAGQMEIPFVPIAQRQQPAQVIDDSIVVVGQARKKKRKRTKADSTSGALMDDGETPGMEDGGVEEEEVEAFDYSTVPNILDDVPTPNTEGRKKKKPKHQKGSHSILTCKLPAIDVFFLMSGGVLEYGNFPAPPKAHRELKAGNQSYTFK